MGQVPKSGSFIDHANVIELMGDRLPRIVLVKDASVFIESMRKCEACRFTGNSPLGRLIEQEKGRYEGPAGRETTYRFFYIVLAFV